jgi:hypothetical protein
MAFQFFQRKTMNKASGCFDPMLLGIFDGIWELKMPTSIGDPSKQLPNNCYS